MDDTVDFICFEGFSDEINVVNVTFDECHTFRHGLCMPCGEIIENHWRQSFGSCQCADRVGTDIAGTTGDKNIHKGLLILLILKYLTSITYGIKGQERACS